MLSYWIIDHNSHGLNKNTCVKIENMYTKIFHSTGIFNKDSCILLLFTIISFSLSVGFLFAFTIVFSSTGLILYELVMMISLYFDGELIYTDDGLFDLKMKCITVSLISYPVIIGILVIIGCIYMHILS